MTIMTVGRTKVAESNRLRPSEPARSIYEGQQLPQHTTRAHNKIPRKYGVVR